MKKLFLALLCALILNSVCASADTSVQGVLLEKGTRKPLAHANVYLLSSDDPPKVLRAETNDQGQFSFPHVENEKLKWVVNLSGYKKLEQEFQFLSENNGSRYRLYLEKSSYQVYETTIYGQGDKRDEKTQTLNQDQFINQVGGNGDPVKAVQNLPGVNRAPPFSALVIIEGSSPDDTGYTVDTQIVPVIFHFGGLTSVVTPEAIDHVDYLSAGFGPEYGQTTAGYVNLFTREPKTDRMHGFGFVDIFNVGGMVEGPITQTSSYLIGARQSYIGAVLGLAAKGNSDFNLTAAPDFQDFIVEYVSHFSPIDAFRVVTIGSSDSLGFILTEPVDQDPSIRGNFSSFTGFFRIIPQWVHRHSDSDISRYWLGFGRDWVRIDTSNYYFRYSNFTLSNRVELEHHFSPEWISYFGTDNNFQWSKLDVQLPNLYTQGGVNNPFSVSQTVSSGHTYQANAAALYWRNVIHPVSSRWTFIPGARLDYFSLTKETLPQPRVATKFDAGEGWSLRAATGLYTQPPQDQQLDAGFGNPALKSPSALHFTTGAEKDFRAGRAAGWILSSDLFYKQLYNLVEPSNATTLQNGVLTPLFYDNNLNGRAFGIEFLAKFQDKPWTAWLTYTLSRSTRSGPGIPESVYQYDQTHSMTAIGSYEARHNWSFSSRARFTSGDPYTPTVGGVLDADNDVYLPLRGGIYSQRVASFFQLDLRMDKKWIYDKWILSAYLDIENLTNRSNPQQIVNSYNYTQTATISGLPLLPTFGFRGEF